VTLPIEIGEVLDDVVWVPMNSPGCRIYSQLGAMPGDRVTLSAGGAA
jgi:NADH-quinone oxidoreductase subunit G